MQKPEVTLPVAIPVNPEMHALRIARNEIVPGDTIIIPPARFQAFRPVKQLQDALTNR